MTDIQVFYIVGGAISIVIFYFLIRGAVKGGVADALFERDERRKKEGL